MILNFGKQIKKNNIAKKKKILSDYIKRFYRDLAITNGDINIPYFMEAQKEIETKLNTDENINYWFRLLRIRKAI